VVIISYLTLLITNLVKLGGKEITNSQLMFTRFSADVNKLAYVLNNKIYLQNLSNMNISEISNSVAIRN
jgi:dipeptidyl-peptidase-4